MNKKNMIILLSALGVALLLGAILILLQTNQPESPPVDPKSLTDFTLEEIIGADVERAEGLLQIRIEDGHLLLYNDPTFDLDQFNALAIITNCAYLSVITPLGSHPESLTEFGLDPPRYRVTIHLHNRDPVTILVGVETIDKSGRYAMLEDTDLIVIVPYYAGDAFSSSMQYLFNRSPGTLNWGDFETFQLQRFYEEDLIFTRNTSVSESGMDPERRYVLQAPIRGYVAHGRIRTLFSDLSALRFDEYLGEFYSLSEYGLDDTRSTFTATDSRGEQIEINLGDSVIVDEKLFFYINRTRDPQNVFLVSEEKVAFFNLMPLPLVDRNLFTTMENGQPTGLSVQHDSQTFDFTFDNNDSPIIKSLQAMQVTSLCEKQSAGAPLLSITAVFEGYSLSVDFYEYTDKLIAVDQGFGQYLSITKTSFEEFLTTAGLHPEITS